MPSWNIHTGLAEKILDSGQASQLGIRHEDSYLWGNLLPDLYVGYMVPAVGHTLRYVDTHYSQPVPIPIPDAQAFWNDWIEPAMAYGPVDDMVLGTWAHLLADHHYNQRVRAYNAAHHIPSGDKTRIAKQGDFDLFGHSLGIHRTLDLTPQVLAEAARYPHYALDPPDLEACIAADKDIVAAAQKSPVSQDYVLLSRQLIADVFDEITHDTQVGLKDYVERLKAAGFDPLAPAPDLPLRRPNLEVLPEPSVRFAKDYQAGAAHNTEAGAARNAAS